MIANKALVLQCIYLEACGEYGKLAEYQKTALEEDENNDALFKRQVANLCMICKHCKHRHTLSSTSTSKSQVAHCLLARGLGYSAIPSLTAFKYRVCTRECHHPINETLFKF